MDTSATGLSPLLRMSEEAFCAWLGTAAPGDVIEYYHGFLAIDVSPNARRLAEHHRKELARLVRRAQWASDKGLAHLLQRRHGPDDYTYLAVARFRPKTVPASITSLLLAEIA